MTLGLVLLTGNDGRGLEPTLRRLHAVVAGGRVPLLIVDQGSDDGTLRRLAGFMADSGTAPGGRVRLLKLSAPEVDLDDATELARAELGADYVLGLRAGDLPCPPALEVLRVQLRARQPDLAICAQGWGLHGAALAPADATRLERMAGTGQPDPDVLYPDPRRLLASAELRAQLGPMRRGSGALADWDLYDRWVGATRRRLIFSDPVLLRPLPVSPVQSLFSALAVRHAACPRGEGRVTALARGLIRIGDEMRFYDPDAAAEVIAAASGLLRVLTWPEARGLRALPGPAAELLATLRAGGRRLGWAAARAQLAAQAAEEDRRRLAALAGELRSLREDLDLALPGPDYLRDLYERVRPK